MSTSVSAKFSTLYIQTLFSIIYSGKSPGMDQVWLYLPPYPSWWRYDEQALYSSYRHLIARSWPFSPLTICSALVSTMEIILLLHQFQIKKIHILSTFIHGRGFGLSRITMIAMIAGSILSIQIYYLRYRALSEIGTLPLPTWLVRFQRVLLLIAFTFSCKITTCRFPPRSLTDWCNIARASLLVEREAEGNTNETKKWQQCFTVIVSATSLISASRMEYSTLRCISGW